MKEHVETVMGGRMHYDSHERMIQVWFRYENRHH
jgi:hypothetical protein